MKSNEEIYRKYLDDLKLEILNRYNTQGRKASGKFEDDMEGLTSELGMKLMGAPHSRFVEKGRKPGKFPPPDAIKEWIEKKEGLPQEFKDNKDQYAYLIGRKIAQQGTQGSDILESVIQEFVDKKLFKMMEELGDAYAVRIQNDIVRLIKNFK